MTRAMCIALLLIAVPAEARAQAPASPAPAKAPAAPHHLWVVFGSGFAAARAGCPACEPNGIYVKSASWLADVGVGVTPHVDAGIELLWVNLKVDGGAPIRTTFVLGVAQVRPWTNHGVLLRAGMGIGVVGNGLFSTIGPPLAPPYTTNALAITYGIGWEFARHGRWGVQVHGLHHVAALGELTTVAGTSIKNVVGNYWTVGAAIVIR